MMVDESLVSDAAGLNVPSERRDAEQARDAIIFIPGLGRDYLDQSVDCISRKIVNALDRNTIAADATYLAKDPVEEEYKDGLKGRRRTVVRKDLSDERPFLDIYEFDHEEELTKRYKERKPISQAVALLMTLGSNITRLPALYRSDGKTTREKLQIFYSMGIMGIIACYAILLIFTAVSSVPGLVNKPNGDEKRIELSDDKSSTPEKPKAPFQSGKNPTKQSVESKVPNLTVQKSSGSKWNSLMDFVRNIIVVLTGLGLFASTSLKSFIKSAATDYSCVVNYLSLGERKRILLGQLSLLVEHIAEMRPRYQRVHIISFSFGSIIALDALYPSGEYFPRYDSVTSLVTIGCPFDIVRTGWPDYFTSRTNPNAAKRTWLNIYNPVDVLGSNFRSDGLVGDAQSGIEVLSENEKTMLLPQNVAIDRNVHLNGLSIANLLALRGIKMHTSYWDPDEKAEISCFDEIVKRLFSEFLMGAEEQA